MGTGRVWVFLRAYFGQNLGKKPTDTRGVEMEMGHISDPGQTETRKKTTDTRGVEMEYMRKAPTPEGRMQIREDLPPTRVFFALLLLLVVCSLG